MKLKEVLDKTITFFKDKKIPSARLDAELLISHGLRLKRIDLYVKFDQPLSDEELEACRQLVRRRSQGEPVAYILEYKGFYKENFFVNSSVLIPRPETEILVEECLAWINSNPLQRNINLADFGSGSGCIGLSLAKENSNVNSVLIENNIESCKVIEKNRELLSVTSNTKTLCKSVQELSLNDFSNNNLDIIVANPPYIADNDPLIEPDVKKYEPHFALFAKENGLQQIKEWLGVSIQLLNKNDSLLLMEIGYNQGNFACSFAKELNFFTEIKILKDLSGHDRVLYAALHK